MQGSMRPKFNAQVCQQACEWFVEFRSGDPDEAARKAFQAWLQESQQHMGAYLQVTALWNESGALDRKGRWTFDTLIAQAAAEEDNVVPLTAPDSIRPEGVAENRALQAARCGRDQNPKRLARPVKLSFAAAALLAITGIAAWFVTQRGTYGTVIGEQRSIALPDGSTVNLNSRSRIQVRYSDRERAVELQQGQALFEVVQQSNRPFIVTSGDTSIRAIGTRFDVYRKSSGTVVTVVEGRVAVLPSSTAEIGKKSAGSEGSSLPARGQRIPPTASDRTPSSIARLVFLRAGEQVTVLTATPARAGAPVLKPQLADIARATAWTQRRLVFEAAPLAEVAEEFNRYNERQLVIRDPVLNSFQIDGVFASTDPASLLRFLRARPGIEVTEGGSAIVVTSR